MENLVHDHKKRSVSIVSFCSDSEIFYLRDILLYICNHKCVLEFFCDSIKYGFLPNSANVHIEVSCKVSQYKFKSWIKANFDEIYGESEAKL